MKTKSYYAADLRPGFTLIEIITVIAIIMALAAMTIGGLSFASKKAELERTRIFIGTVSQALEQYRADTGEFPRGDGGTESTKEVYAALYGDFDGDGEPDDGMEVYLSSLDPKLKGKSSNVRQAGDGYVLVDAWGEKDDRSTRQELFYRHDPDGNDNANMMNPPSDFDLWSLGPDGEGGPQGGDKASREDDLTNWK